MRRVQNTLTQKIYEYIHMNPGCTRKEILTIFPPEENPRTVGTLLANLRKNKAIVTRGGKTSAARWYPVETQVNAHHLEIASTLLSELEKVHPVIWELYMARRLEETFVS